VKKILLVDDEPEFVSMLQMRLEANRYDVVTANDGREGLQKIAEENPDLVLLDVMMPGMDGFEVLEKLRKSPSTKYLPVVLLTARGESSSIFKGQELGATDYLTKPCASEDLLAVIRKHIGGGAPPSA